MKNIGDMLKQVQSMQARITEVQERLEKTTVTGQSGGGMVKITLSGKGIMKSVEIDPSLMKPDERDILEDLVVAAHNDAKSKSEVLAADEMKSVTGGLPLPPGFKLPF
ncbi:MAG: YbaB/EbfC family nucleoid-associated protein [Aestuariivirga sp.]